MSARDVVLGRIRAALGRNDRDGVAVPPAMIRVPVSTAEDRISQFQSALNVLAGKTYVAEGRQAAADYVRTVVAGRKVVTTASPLVSDCSRDLSRVETVDTAAVGITGAEYALADTGTIVVMSASEARLVSLLPPVHIALIESERILSGLDEFLSRVPRPGDLGASTVFITGPSRTADIEQILVRGVHGPGELHVVIVV